ncbi:unnamed protein product, partial [marine sediment metagenome]
SYIREMKDYETEDQDRLRISLEGIAKWDLQMMLLKVRG